MVEWLPMLRVVTNSKADDSLKLTDKLSIGKLKEILKLIYYFKVAILSH